MTRWSTHHNAADQCWHRYGSDHRELAEAIARVVGYSGKFVQDTTKPDARCAGDGCIKDPESGWKANTSLQEGINMTYKKFYEAYA